MKNQLEVKKTIKTNNRLTINSFKKSEVLNLNAMNSIRGGDGEANGGGDIIIIPKSLKK